MDVTLTLDDEPVKKVRKIAVDPDTTLTGMIREDLNAGQTYCGVTVRNPSTDP